MIASDVVMIIRYLLDKTDKTYKFHLPGPFGKIGGYPVLFNHGAMSLDETVFTEEEMTRVNRQSLSCDGIENTDENGIHFTDEAIWKMKDIFDIDYPKTLALEDCENFAEKIAERLVKWKNIQR